MAEVLHTTNNSVNPINNENIYTWFSFGSNSSGLLLLNNQLQDVHTPTPIKQFKLENLTQQQENRNNQKENEDSTLNSLNFNEISQLLCSGMHTAVITDSGSLYVAGDINRKPTEQLNFVQISKTTSKGDTQTIRKIKTVGVGWTNTVISTDLNEIFNILNNNIQSPIQLTMPSNDVIIDSISCGYKHVIMLSTSTNSIYGFGSNKFGQLGAATVKHIEQPLLIQVFSSEIKSIEESIKQISCGWYFSMLLTVSGKVFSCGLNKHGQMGMKASDSSLVHQWKIIESLNEIIQIACGWSHCLALQSNGTVFGWGRADRGQIGLRPVLNSNNQLVQAPFATEPLLINDHKRQKLVCSAVYCGSEHSLMVHSVNHQVYFCGWNEHGNSGLNHTNNVLEPEPIIALSSSSIQLSDMSKAGSLSHSMVNPEFMISTGGAAVFVKRKS